VTAPVGRCGEVHTGGPTLTIVIPSHARPHLLPDAIESALSQTMSDLEVVVVDDGSPEPVRLAADPRLRLVRLPVARGNGGARNAGLSVARGRWLTCVDDDDVMLPHLAEVSLEAAERAILPPPVGVLSGVAVVGGDGRVLEERFPPTRPRGCHFSLESRDAGRSYFVKQTLVVETDVLRAIGGWDASFRSRTVTEMFLRLNPVCSLLGLDVVTYQLRVHDGPRLSRDPRLRHESFVQLVGKHRSLLEAHPEGYADLLVDHACMSLGDGRWSTAIAAAARAARQCAPVAGRRWRDLVGAAGRRLLGHERSG
jgi:glycosyltransferase involved in cell wall biosynthesis